MAALHDHRFPSMTYADIRAELDRSMAATDLDAAVAKGAMTRAEAAAQNAMVAALRQDVDRFAAYAQMPAPRPPQRDSAPGHAMTWQSRRAFLLDELHRRQRTYPAAIAKGNLAPAAAVRQFDRLAALLAQYEDGMDFAGTRDDWRARFDDMLAEQNLGLRVNFRLHLDTAPRAESFQQPAPASGRPMVDKGPHDDRSRQPARTLL